VIKPGPRNLITDVGGLLVGNAEDERVLTGVTVVLPDTDAVAAVELRGGAPCTRETDALDPSRLVETVHGVVLSGGSVYGLDAASGVVQWLGARGRGVSFRPGPPVAPVVPAGGLYDLANGGDKAWGDTPPYRSLGIAACEVAATDFRLGNAGAGIGAVAGAWKGGLGSASVVCEGVTVGALAAVNSYGSPVVPGTGALWAAPFAIGDELGSSGFQPADVATRSFERGTKAELIAGNDGPGRNTTVAVVATDARLTRSEARRIAVMAADGMARALRPVHSPYDGDVVFVLATAGTELSGPRARAITMIGSLAADTLARAIARGVYEAASIAGWRSYRDAMDRG